MPGLITELSQSQIVADLGAELRRLRRALASSQLPTWTHDIFTAPATYQLTYIPYGINVVADNGTALSEGTDYTVDYATGLITFTVGRTAGHGIYVSYVTTGDLTALSGPVDTGRISDNFNRANSATTLGTTSDGTATWVPLVGTWGISSNQAYDPSGTGSGDVAVIDTGTSDGIVQVDLTQITTAGGLSFRVQDSANRWNVSVTPTSGTVHIRVAGVDLGAVGSTFACGPGHTLAVQLSGSSINVLVDGVTVQSLTDSRFAAATQHGLWSNNANTLLDNFSFTY